MEPTLWRRIQPGRTYPRRFPPGVWCIDHASSGSEGVEGATQPTLVLLRSALRCEDDDMRDDLAASDDVLGIE